MILDCVLTACNDNPLYMNFIPIFINTWKKLYPYVDVKIIFISAHVPEHLQQYDENIILFEPIGISTAFISQYIRLLYPCILNYENGILISDIDILPMNKSYYSENIAKFNNEKFIYMRNVLLEIKQIAMCYNIATSATWKNIFNINNIDDIKTRLRNKFNSIEFIEGAGNNGWFTDQLDLYSSVYKWNLQCNNLIILNDNTTKFKRLDRSSIKLPLDDDVLNNIQKGIYSDYHCLRPYNNYKEINNIIFENLMD